MFVPVTQDHIQDIVTLNETCGFPERSAAGWRWAIFENPQQGDEPCGYVAMRKDQVAGFVGTQRRNLTRGHEKISLTCGHTILTDLKSPGTGFRLLKHAFNSQSGDIVATLNNNALSAPIYRRVNLLPWLGERGRFFAEITTNFRLVALSAALRRIPKLDALTTNSEYFNYECLAKAKQLTHLNGFARIDPYNVSDAAQLDDLHQAMLDSTDYQADRSAKTWQHRSADPDAPGAMHLFAHSTAGRIQALIVISITKETEHHPPTGEIEDIAIRPNTRVNLSDVFDAAESFGREAGLARIKLRYTKGITEPGIFPNSNWTLRQHSYDCIHAHAANEDLQDHWAVGPVNADFYFSLRRIRRKIASCESPAA